MKPIYLDYNATTPHDKDVIEAIRPFLEKEFGNPSSSHYFGTEPKKAVNNARGQIANMLNCNKDEVVFTSCGTESNNYAIMGTVSLLKNSGNHIITSCIEHPAVLEVCRYLEKNGFSVTYLTVDEYGFISLDELERSVRPDTILISIMHANNEVGSIQPIEEISKIAKDKGIIFHTDAAQSIGKISVDVNESGVDLLTIAGHKLYAPKGIGALYVRKGLDLTSILHGAGQENGRRPGTENVMGITGLGKACEIIGNNLENNTAHLMKMRDMLYGILFHKLDNLKFNSLKEKCLPNTLNVSFKGIEANQLLNEIAGRVVASAGAACHSDNVRISHVLEAMKVPMEWAKGTIRISTGRMTTKDEINIAGDVICGAVSLFRGH